jgi:hypothetical protein
MSLTPHAYGKCRISLQIRIYMQKCFNPLIRGQDLCFNEKTENLVTLYSTFENN